MITCSKQRTYPHIALGYHLTWRLQGTSTKNRLKITRKTTTICTISLYNITCPCVCLSTPTQTPTIQSWSQNPIQVCVCVCVCVSPSSIATTWLNHTHLHSWNMCNNDVFSILATTNTFLLLNNQIEPLHSLPAIKTLYSPKRE